LQHQEQEIYSLYVMDEVDLTAYNDAKKATAEKRNLLSAIQGKIASIGTVQQQELKKLYNNAEPVINTFTREQIKADDEVETQLLDAKYQYLQQVVAIAGERHDIYELDYKLADIEVDAGLKQRNYTDLDRKSTRLN